MSFRPNKFLSFRESVTRNNEQFLEGKSEEELKNLFLEVLYDGVHGFCFSLYEEGQQPGDQVSEAQIRKRMEILKPHSSWVRSFSCIDGNEHIPKIAREMGLKTLVGAWMGSDEQKNREEIEGLARLAEEGQVDIAAVGNEVLYRKDLSLHELLNYIQEVRERIPGIPVAYVDAYYEFAQRPELVDACDLILCNCYPYWEGTEYRYALQHMQQMYQQALLAGKGKRVIITETGWPSAGEKLGNSIPSSLNAMKYFINTQLWSKDENIEIFYFSSFDEAWKVDTEGDVGAYWGIWDKDRKLKFVNEHLS